jgi:hypothetical protein
VPYRPWAVPYRPRTVPRAETRMPYTVHVVHRLPHEARRQLPIQLMSTRRTRRTQRSADPVPPGRQFIALSPNMPADLSAVQSHPCCHCAIGSGSGVGTGAEYFTAA